jgi:protein MAK11
MAKRKRDTPTPNGNTDHHDAAPKITKTNGHIDVKTSDTKPSPVIQIIAGSYERVLHGITASISDLSSSTSNKTTAASVSFADTFLFNAHAGAIKCLALSPLPDSNSADIQGVYLATGGSDEKVNVFSLSTSPAIQDDRLPSMPSLGKNSISENPRNRELGTILEHSAHITALHFPTRSKLLSAAEDNTVAVTRLKDLTTVSSIKVPRPKVQGQPSGDTAPPGVTPAGINDFSVHPSLKVMLSVGRGERCMRLWNLVTGKKAGVLNFDKGVLQSVKESKYSSGEGRRIRWSPDGTEFAVAFERGVVVFGDDSRPKCRILPGPLTKVHQINSLSLPREGDEDVSLLAISTEDGRVLFYDTTKTGTPSTDGSNGTSQPESQLLDAAHIATIGGKEAGLITRIKDFELLLINTDNNISPTVLVVTASSDGTIRLIPIPVSDLLNSMKSKNIEAKQMGSVIGTYETGNRITCLKSFVMSPSRKGEDELRDEDFSGLEDGDDSEDSDSDE